VKVTQIDFCVTFVGRRMSAFTLEVMEDQPPRDSTFSVASGDNGTPGVNSVGIF